MRPHIIKRDCPGRSPEYLANPPFSLKLTAFLPASGLPHFLPPQTINLPLFERAPLIGGQTRGLLDVGCYLALLVFCVLALVSPAPGPREWLPVVVLVAVLGVLDQTVFLAARAEHY